MPSMNSTRNWPDIRARPSFTSRARCRPAGKNREECLYLAVWIESGGDARLSELAAQADGGVDVGRGQVAAGHAVVHAAVHGAEVSVEVLVEVVVSVEGKGLEVAAANAVRGSRAAGLLAGAVGVLIVAVVGHGQIEVRNDCVAGAGPKHIHRLRFVVGIVGDEGQNVIADVIEPGAQRRRWIGILDALIAGK